MRWPQLFVGPRGPSPRCRPPPASDSDEPDAFVSLPGSDSQDRWKWDKTKGVPTKDALKRLRKAVRSGAADARKRALQHVAELAEAGPDFQSALCDSKVTAEVVRVFLQPLRPDSGKDADAGEVGAQGAKVSGCGKQRRRAWRTHEALPLARRQQSTDTASWAWAPAGTAETGMQWWSADPRDTLLQPPAQSSASTAQAGSRRAPSPPTAPSHLLPPSFPPLPFTPRAAAGGCRRRPDGSVPSAPRQLRRRRRRPTAPRRLLVSAGGHGGGGGGPAAAAATRAGAHSGAFVRKGEMWCVCVRRAAWPHATLVPLFSLPKMLAPNTHACVVPELHATSPAPHTLSSPASATATPRSPTPATSACPPPPPAY